MRATVRAGLSTTIASYQSTHGAPPTLDALATSVGIPREFRQHLDGILESEVAQGRLACTEGRYRLTHEGRVAIEMPRHDRQPAAGR